MSKRSEKQAEAALKELGTTKTTAKVEGILDDGQIEKWFMEKVEITRRSIQEEGVVHPVIAVLHICTTHQDHSLETLFDPSKLLDGTAKEAVLSQFMTQFLAQHGGYIRMFIFVAVDEDEAGLEPNQQTSEHVVYILENWREERLMVSRIRSLPGGRRVLGDLEDHTSKKALYNRALFRWMRPDKLDSDLNDGS